MVATAKNRGLEALKSNEGGRNVGIWQRKEGKDTDSARHTQWKCLIVFFELLKHLWLVRGNETKGKGGEEKS